MTMARLLPWVLVLPACGGDGAAARDAAPEADATPLAPLPVGLLVASRGSNAVLHYDGAGAALGTFAASPSLVRPVGVTFGPDGHLYVAVGDTNRILRFDGTSLTTFVEDPLLDGPTSFTFGPDGNLYVPGVLSNKVLRFDGATGALLGTFATEGLLSPHDVSFGPDGNFYVTNSSNGLVQRFRGDSGAFIDTFVSDGLQQPLGMAWGPDGNLYVSNQGNNEVRRYDGATGAPLGPFVRRGAGGLEAPAFLAFRPPAEPSLAAAPGPAATLVVVLGARPGARVVLAHGTAGSGGRVDACPELDLPVAAAAVDGTRIADESGAVVASLPLAPGATWVAVDAARCVAITSP